ncbi:MULTISPECIES: hypothetical protein [unclassified Paraburkholderia]|uniref:hypothetical protein n=1 Tax=unclassified Paraburkholderia TaxID=2615204 RepID=UPI002AB0570B|nr:MULTISPECIES: hypothetical protein [unclassified Paraburkholderia]
MSTRRDFLKAGVAGLGLAFAANHARLTMAATDGALIDRVQTICKRLGEAGWRDLLMAVTAGQLDILAPDLKTELAKDLSRIDRRYQGFGDFALAGRRGIEPGQPDYSLLYHALAAPSVVADHNGAPLRAFPTLAEIDDVENYIYASRQVSLDTLRAEFSGLPVAVVTFATQYRNAPMAVNGRHAQLCFSRSGVGRIGNLAPRYDGQLRSFVGTDENNVFDFHVVPRRFSHYLAVQMPVDSGASPGFGPQDKLADDKDRQFWVPLHKIFNGSECLTGMNLQVLATRGMLNDEVASFHRFLDNQKLQNNWTGATLEQYPFSIRDEKIASLSTDSEYGPGVLIPRANVLVEEARFRGARLTFPVDPHYSGKAVNMQMSSLFVLPGGAPPHIPKYFDDAEQGKARPAPEYINIRHRVVDGKIDNLNDRPNLMEILERGNYQAQHYIDFSGDGWIVATCPELAKAGITVSKPAFCMIGLPDFLPKVGQRDLMLWWNNEMPKPLRAALWATPPFALSQTRIAANIELPAGFSIDDDTVSAIVAQPQRLDNISPEAEPQKANGSLRFDKVGLPDGSPGLFDPGWDTSLGVDKSQGGKLKRFLVSHGLGSPFIEDAKLCAALGSYWPGVAPDATRQYQPDKHLSGISYPWPTAVPFTDEEIGITRVANGPLKGRLLPWDGVPGPRRAMFNGKPVIEYENELRVDYIDLMGTMTAALTSRIDLHEYQARTLSMAAVYWSLGIQDDAKSSNEINMVLREKASWAVLSFTRVPQHDAELQRIVEQTGAQLNSPWHYYRFELFRWGARHSDPRRLKVVFVDILEEATAYTDGRHVILKRDDKWTVDNTIPT